MRHRIHPERQALVEIVGFWTPDYLTEKLARLRQAALPAFVLCIDEERACAPSELPPGLPVVTFRRRVDAAAVMREVERLTAGGNTAAAAIVRMTAGRRLRWRDYRTRAGARPVKAFLDTLTDEQVAAVVAAMKDVAHRRTRGGPPPSW